jgi:hypothetical protein
LALASLFLAPAATAGADSLGNPFRVSFSSSDDTLGYSGFDPSLAYDGKRDRYLSVWCATTPVADAPDQIRIWARFIGGDGVPQGDAVAISDERPRSSDSKDCADPNRDATVQTSSDPWAVYNPTADEFMVVWHAGSAQATLQQVGHPCDLGVETEIFAQRLGAATGDERGTNDRVVSDSVCAVDPMVAYDATADDYLVVWGNEPSQGSPWVSGQRLDSSGAFIANQFDISASEHASLNPYVIDIPGSKRFLVAYEDTAFDESDERSQEIHGQYVDAESGAKVGAEDFMIGAARGAQPALAFNSQAGEALAVWTDGTDLSEAPPIVVSGQRVSVDGVRNGDPFVVSTPEFTGGASHARVAYDTRANQYQVVFQAEAIDLVAALPPVSSATRIYGQRINAAGARIGTDGFEVSTLDGDEEARGIEYNPARCEYMTLWEADLGEKFEIFGRRLAGGAACPTPAPKPAPAAGVLGVQSRSCASRRFFRIRIVERRADRIRTATVTVAGKRAAISYGRRVTARIDLRQLPKGAFTVHIKVKLKSGRTLKGTRRYHTCTKAQNPHKRLKL